jgi:nucleotide-binding universal stress UspA family protein
VAVQEAAARVSLVPADGLPAFAAFSSLIASLVPGAFAMIALKTVLVPTDFSDPSEIAFRYGKAFAESFGASLHLLHVVDSASMYVWGSPEGAVGMPAGAYDEAERYARERLQGLLTMPEQERFRAVQAIVTGSPFVEIVRYAKRQEIDLIVMGTHGRGPIAHMLMGSVAERVVRKAPCPVLTVRHPEHEFVMP